MICEKCGKELGEDSTVCKDCSSKEETKLETVSETNEGVKDSKSAKKNFKLNSKYIMVVGCVVVLAFVFFFVYKNNSKPNKNRSKVLLNLEKEKQLKFTLDEQEFYIGDKISSYQEKGYDYTNIMVDDDDLIPSDSISIQTFYNKNKASFLGALYCSSSEACKYEDTIMVKINFYKNSKVLVDDYLKIGMKYEEVVKKYGKEDGKFYQDDTYLVWALGEKGKIGQPYYLLKFDTNSLLPSNAITEIRIGVWWYDGEYEHTILKNTNKEEK